MFAIGATERQAAAGNDEIDAGCCRTEQLEPIIAAIPTELDQKSLFNFSSADLERVAGKLCRSSAAAFPLHLGIMGRVMPRAQRGDLCRRTAAQSAYADNLPVLKLLFGEDSPGGLPPSEAHSALTCAAYSASVDTVQWLLQLLRSHTSAPQPNLGQDLLQWACWGGNLPVVRFILAEEQGSLSTAAFAAAATAAACSGQIHCLQTLRSSSVCTAELCWQALVEGARQASFWRDGEADTDEILQLMRELPGPMPVHVTRSIMQGVTGVLSQRRGTQQVQRQRAQLACSVLEMLLSQEHGTEPEHAEYVQALNDGLLQQVTACCHTGHELALRELLALDTPAAHRGGGLDVGTTPAAHRGGGLDVGTALFIALKPGTWRQHCIDNTSAVWRANLGQLLRHGRVAVPLRLRPQLSGGSRPLHRQALTAACGEEAVHTLLSCAQRGVLKPCFSSRLPLTAPLRQHCSVLRRACWAGDEEGLYTALGMMMVGAPLAVLPWGCKGLQAHVMLDDAVRGGMQGAHARWKENEGKTHPSAPRRRMLRVLFGLCGSFAAPFSAVGGQEVLRQEWRAARWGGSALRHGRRGAVLCRSRQRRKPDSEAARVGE